MNKDEILVLSRADLKIKDKIMTDSFSWNDFKPDMEFFKLTHNSNFVIFIELDGTTILLKNRFGDDGLVQKRKRNFVRETVDKLKSKYHINYAKSTTK